VSGRLPTEVVVERFEHNGVSLVVDTLGGAGTRHVVFLHGWGANRESLRGIATLFQTEYRVHLLDLPGFGAAPLPPPGWDTINYSDLVQQYLLERTGGSVVLVGHSFGGRLAIRLAARRLPHIRAIVLMGVPGLPLRAWSSRWMRSRWIRGLRRALTVARPITGPAPLAWHSKRFGSKDYLAAGDLRSVLVKVVNEDLTESARAIACPTFLLWGDEDRETPPELAHRYRALVAGPATVEFLPHKDHYLFTGTGAHLCASRIRAWLRLHVES